MSRTTSSGAPAACSPISTPCTAAESGFREFWDRFRDAWEFIDVEPKAFWEVGDTILMPLRFHAKGRESGVEVDLDWVNAFSFDEDDVAVRAAAYPSLEAALAGEGISRDALPPDAASDQG